MRYQPAPLSRQVCIRRNRQENGNDFGDALPNILLRLASAKVKIPTAQFNWPYQPLTGLNSSDNGDHTAGHYRRNDFMNPLGTKHARIKYIRI
jgi:hypothetical protein